MKKNGRLSRPLLIVLATLISLPWTLDGQDELHRVWVIQNCRVLNPLGPALEKATIIIRDGTIESIGPAAAVPPGAEVLDGAKLTAFPGFIDALGTSLLKLPEEKFDPMKVYTGEFTEKDRGITPGLKAFDYVNLGKSVLEKYHKFGITAAHVLPDKGLLTGQASLFSLSDSNKNKALLLKDNCLGVGFSPAGFIAYPYSLMGAVVYLKQAFTDASHYLEATSRWVREMRGFARPPYDANLEILSGFVGGKKPVVFFCKNHQDLLRALEMAAEFKLDALFFDGGSEAWRVLPELKKAKARVLCPVTFKVPVSSIYAQKGKAEKEKAEKDIYPKNPARMAEAGVAFAFSSLGADDPKTFLEGIQKAVEAGLKPDKAMEALTSTPASFLGVEKALGTLEAGKIANLVLAEGEPLAKDSKVRYVFSDGRKFELKETKAKEGEAPAVNISGRWEFTIPGAPTLAVDFVQEEAALSGKMTTPFGIFDFTGGSVTGKEIYFEMNISVGGQTIDLYFTATVEGDVMRGTVVQGTEGSQEFTAKRIPG